MAGAQCLLKSDDLLDTRLRVAQDDPVFGKALNRKLTCRALDDGVWPSEIHPLECSDERFSRRAYGLGGTACDKDVSKQGDVACAFSHGPQRFPIGPQARRNLVETGRRSDDPAIAEPRGAANCRFHPGAKPDRGARPLQRPRGDRYLVELIMSSAMGDVLFCPEAFEQRSALLQSATALLDGKTERSKLFRSVPCPNA